VWLNLGTWLNEETTPISQELLGGPSLDAPETLLGVVPQFSLNSTWELGVGRILFFRRKINFISLAIRL
jgi:hypothetical protein